MRIIVAASIAMAMACMSMAVMMFVELRHDRVSHEIQMENLMSRVIPVLDACIDRDADLIKKYEKGRWAKK